MNGVEIVKIKEKDIQGAYVIDGFPSVGLVGSIVANYLVAFLKLEQIAVVESMSFPAVSLVRGGVPHSPVRVYAGERGEDKIVVFVSEFQPPANLIKPLAAAIMDWVRDHQCKMIISPEGAIVQAEPGQADQMGGGPGSTVGSKVWGIGSTKRAMELLKENDIPVFENGVIVGLASVLLNEGVNRDIDVIILLSEAHAEYPDARAAATVTSAIDKILLHTDLDTKPLIDEAAVIEEGLKDVYKRAGKKDELAKIRSIMYG